MKDIILLKSNFDDTKIWGGQKLKSYGYDGTSNKIGEAYLISALEDRSSFIINDDIKEKNLYDFYKNNKEWFNNYEGDYPLLSKIIDAKDDLSVQVHPDDNYAKNKFSKLGKTEAWYILDCNVDSDIVYGLKTNNKEDIKKAINNNDWSSILNYLPIKKDDVLFIPSGIVHAIKKNTLLFEIQQSSDLTFRLYDYDRVDDNGNKRELHIEDSLNVINFDHDCKITSVQNNIMVSSKFFTTEIYDISNWKNFFYKDVYWIELVVLDGEGTLNNNIKLKRGISAIIRSKVPFKIKGNIKVALTYIIKE